MDEDAAADGGANRFVWFMTGALTVAAAVALFLYIDGYFDPSVEAAGTSRTIIEAK